jgi:hypothetical protein
MIEGINFVTDDKGKEKALILDLMAFKKNNVKASDVINALSGLQELIDKAGVNTKPSGTWDLAKKELKNLKP